MSAQSPTAWGHAIEAALIAALITALLAQATFIVMPLGDEEGKWLYFTTFAAPSVIAAFVVTAAMWLMFFRPGSGGFWAGGVVGAIAVPISIIVALLLLPASAGMTGLIDKIAAGEGDEFLFIAIANSFAGVAIVALAMAFAPVVIFGVYMPVGAIAGALIRWRQKS